MSTEYSTMPEKKFSSVTVNCFNPDTHKVVPKDAVVLDIYDDERGSLPKFLNEIMGWIRQGLVENIAGGTGVLERIRDQIEAQTKPPRIPEPGWGEKVIAHVQFNEDRLRWVRVAHTAPRRWTCEDASEYDRTWEELLDPELV